jgi:hypothetical protein
MPLETGTYINSLNSSNPVATDGLAFADEHFRLIKATILATFPNITGEMSATHSVLNGLDARVTAIESGVHASGTKMLFQQSTAPTGWTKDATNYNDHAIRVVTGTASSGGSNAFSTLDATAAGTINTSVTGSVGGTALTTAQLPNNWYHKPNTPGGELSDNYANFNYQARHIDWPTYRIQGSGQAHSHSLSLSATSTFTGSANALDVQYVDVIIATKD